MKAKSKSNYKKMPTKSFVFCESETVYNKIGILAFIKFFLVGFVGLLGLCLLLYLLFLNHITTAFDLFTRILIMSPIGMLIAWFSPRISGYSLSDEGIARCRFNKEGYFYVDYINWRDVIRLDYKPAYVKGIDFDQVTVHSIYGNKISVDDSQYAFQEILHVIQDKTKMNSRRFIINDSHKIIIFDNSDNIPKSDFRATEKPFQWEENIKQLPMIKHNELKEPDVLN